MKDQFYEFTKQYDFSVDIPDVDDDTGVYLDTETNISGTLTFYGDAFWNESDDSFEYSFSWEDSSDIFSHDGNAPAKEEEFINDFRDYLLQQGVPENNVW